MRKLKKYKVTVEFWRESFSGHDYLDYSKIFEVEAMNRIVAVKKVKALAGGKVVKVQGEDADDWTIFG